MSHTEREVDVGIERVGVVGAGLMGSGIAEVCARGGADVIVCETDAKTSAAGPRSASRTSLARAVRSGKLDEAGSDVVLGRVVGSPPTSAISPTVSSWSRPSSSRSTRSSTCSRTLDKILDERRRDPRVEHVVDPDHEARDGDAAVPRTCSGCTSSTRCRCSTSWSSSRRSSRARSPPTASRTSSPTKLGQAGHPLAGPRRLHRELPVRAVRALRDPDARVRLRVGRRHRRRHGRGLLAPDGPARARRPHRPRHDQGGRRLDVRGVQGAALRRRRRFSAAWWKQACSVASAAAASSTTPK